MIERENIQRNIQWMNRRRERVKRQKERERDGKDRERGWQREREKDRKREKKRQRERESEKDRERDRGKKTERERERKDTWLVCVGGGRGGEDMFRIWGIQNPGRKIQDSLNFKFQNSKFGFHIFFFTTKIKIIWSGSSGASAIKLFTIVINSSG
jgi:hypothetical protein